MTPTNIALLLGGAGLAVCPNFLGAFDLAGLRLDLARLQREEKFHRAGVGHGAELHGGGDIRRDEICWLNPESGVAAQHELWEKMRALKEAFNQTLFLGLTEFEGHYASYPAGGFYQRHRDSFREDGDRMVSVVIYLNEVRKKSDGGQLRVFQNESHTDIEPTGGTLVCFLSKEMEHEVLPSLNSRISFTGWFKVARSNHAAFSQPG